MAWTVSGLPAADAAPAGAARLCSITDPRIDESSGLAAAGDQLYTINDGGSRLQVFVLDRGCRVRRVISNPTDPYDVEDLARTADGTLWLADIGDNDTNRSTVALELLTEGGEVTLFRFRYPDGPHDAETLLVDGRGRPYIVTKEPLRSGVYTPDGSPSTTRATPLRKVGTLTFGPTGTSGGPVGIASQVLATGGAVAPDGSRLVIRTYTDAYLWTIPNGDIAAALRADPERRIPLPATRQGEAVTFAPDGRSLLTSTEIDPAPIDSIPLGDPPATTAAPASGSATGAASAGPSSTSAAAERAGDSNGSGSGARNLLIAAVLATGLIWLGSRLRAGRRR